MRSVPSSVLFSCFLLISVIKLCGWVIVDAPALSLPFGPGSWGYYWSLSTAWLQLQLQANSVYCFFRWHFYFFASPLSSRAIKQTFKELQSSLALVKSLSSLGTLWCRYTSTKLGDSWSHLKAMQPHWCLIFKKGLYNQHQQDNQRSAKSITANQR